MASHPSALESRSLPDGETLHRLEWASRRQGSGLGQEDVEGDWSRSLPDGETLHRLEWASRRQGSGLGQEDVEGDWLVEQVWEKKGRNSPAVSGAILRALSAQLRINSRENGELLLHNSVDIGLLRISFFGPGQLEQRRPLLFFHFDQLVLSLAGKKLFRFSLPAPADNRRPFFALIASQSLDANKRWLAARGRGGGMALWVATKMDQLS